MQIIIDKINNAIIATGTFAGKSIKAVAACREEGDVFDEEFGRQLVKYKYKIKERSLKIAAYKKNIKVLQKLIKKIEANINTNIETCKYLEEQNDKEKRECNSFIEQYYEKK